MAKIDLTIPSLENKFSDLRSTIPGDSFNWSWTRPLAQVKYLAVHHTAGPISQTPQQIANFHINSNGWGGIGYHFLIGNDGTVYYVGDISTARANVANLNEQVLGICLIGNFTNGNNPSTAQLDSLHKLCDYFINNYPALSNVKSWDAMRGHKDLPGQATACPGTDWPTWRQKVINSGSSPAISGIIFNGPTAPSNQRRENISELYRMILGRDPDEGGLSTYISSSMSIPDIMKSMIDSHEHKGILVSAREVLDMKNKIASLNERIASLQGQIEFFEVALEQKEQEVAALQNQLQATPRAVPITIPPKTDGQQQKPPDNTFTLAEALVNLYKLVMSVLFPVQKVS